MKLPSDYLTLNSYFPKKNFLKLKSSKKSKSLSSSFSVLPSYIVEVNFLSCISIM